MAVDSVGLLSKINGASYDENEGGGGGGGVRLEQMEQAQVLRGEEESGANDNDDDANEVFNDANEDCLAASVQNDTHQENQLRNSNYAELNLKRISVSKCFGASVAEDETPCAGSSTGLDTLANVTVSTSVNNGEPLSFLMSSFQSLNKSKSRSRSRSSSSSSSSSNCSSSSMVFSANKQLTKKIKLSSILLPQAANVIVNNSSSNKSPIIILGTTHPPNNTNTNNAKLSRFKRIKHKFQRGNKKITVTSECSDKSVKKCSTKLNKKMMRNKFSKLNENDNLSRSYLGSSISNFSLSNNNNNTYYNQTMKKKIVKCMLVGDAQVGKSTILTLFLKRIFQSEYKPTIVDDYEVKVNHNGEYYTLNLYDTAGQEDWETLRIMAYPETDVIILCYSVVRPDSMENILTKWIPELNKFIPGVLIILVGTQVDLRDVSPASSTNTSTSTDKPRYVSTREGEELRDKIKAFKFIECSAITQLNIQEIFDSCVHAYTNSNRKVQPSCFQSMFRHFANSLRRRFTFRRSANNSAPSIKTSIKSPAKRSRKYLICTYQ